MEAEGGGPGQGRFLLGSESGFIILYIAIGIILGQGLLHSSNQSNQSNILVTKEV
jgi:hypothetical protein